MFYHKVFHTLKTHYACAKAASFQLIFAFNRYVSDVKEQYELPHQYMVYQNPDMM